MECVLDTNRIVSLRHRLDLLNFLSVNNQLRLLLTNRVFFAEICVEWRGCTMVRGGHWLDDRSEQFRRVQELEDVGRRSIVVCKVIECMPCSEAHRLPPPACVPIVATGVTFVNTLNRHVFPLLREQAFVYMCPKAPGTFALAQVLPHLIRIQKLTLAIDSFRQVEDWPTALLAFAKTPDSRLRSLAIRCIDKSSLALFKDPSVFVDFLLATNVLRKVTIICKVRKTTLTEYLERLSVNSQTQKQPTSLLERIATCGASHNASSRISQTHFFAQLKSAAHRKLGRQCSIKVGRKHSSTRTELTFNNHTLVFFMTKLK